MLPHRLSVLRSSQRRRVVAAASGGGLPSAVAGFVLTNYSTGWKKFDAQWSEVATTSEVSFAEQTRAVVDVGANKVFVSERGYGIVTFDWEPFGANKTGLIVPFSGNNLANVCVYEPEQYIFVATSDEKMSLYDYSGALLDSWSTGLNPGNGGGMVATTWEGVLYVFYSQGGDGYLRRLNTETGMDQLLMSAWDDNASSAVDFDYKNSRVVVVPDAYGLPDPIWTCNPDGSDQQEIFSNVANQRRYVGTDVVNGVHYFYNTSGGVSKVPLLGGSAEVVLSDAGSYVSGISVAYEPWR